MGDVNPGKISSSFPYQIFLQTIATCIALSYLDRSLVNNKKTRQYREKLLIRSLKNQKLKENEKMNFIVYDMIAF